MNIIENFQKLVISQKTSELAKDNIFKILGIENMEIKHSNFLAYLFNPNINENINNHILFNFLKECKIDRLLNSSISEIFSNSTKIDIYREYKNIDLIINISPFCTIIIENKIWTDEHDNQLFKYYSSILQELNTPSGKFNNNSYKSPICIYLTPEGRKSKDENNTNWTPFSYSQIYTILLKFQSKYLQLLSNKQKMLIDDYLQLLKESIVKTEREKKELLDNYFSNKDYKKVMEQIIDIIPNYKKRAKIIKEECGRTDIEIINDTEKSISYINIIPKCFQNIFNEIGVGKHFFFFQVINNQSFKTSSILTYFDFSSKDKLLNKNKAQSFYEFLSNNKNFKEDTSKDRALGYSFVYLTQKDEYSMNEDKKQEIIKEFFADFENKQEVQYLYKKLLEFQRLNN